MSDLKDPRSHRTYRALRLTYIATAPHVCALCGHGITGKPTIEHRVPIRVILATATTQDEVLAMCCDTTTWALAHSRCQSQQGQAASTASRFGKPERRASRVW